MEAWADRTGQRPTSWSEWTYGIYPPYRKLAEKAVRADSARLDNHAAHIRSSQAFAFNLFLPFREGARTRLSEAVGQALGTDMRIDRVQFEWIPPGALLGELVGEWPDEDEPATAVDVALWARLANGRRAAVLVEVKLSEAGFTPCNGPRSNGNRRRDVCQSARLFFDDPAACYPSCARGGRTGTGDTGRYSRRATAVCATRSPEPPWTVAARSSTTLSSLCGTLAIARGLEQEGPSSQCLVRTLPA